MAQIIEPNADTSNDNIGTLDVYSTLASTDLKSELDATLSYKVKKSC